MKQSNLKNRTIFCRDNIDILQGINSNSIDLIYLDPPFNKKKIFTAPIGSSAEGASFKDWFKEEDVKNEWVQTIKEDNIELYNFLTGIKTISTNKYYLYNYCYLSYMAIRLIEMQRILKDTGNIYLHCDPTMSHYIKLLMDIILGEKNFRNEIVWCYIDPAGRKKSNFYKRTHDLIFWYSKSKEYKLNQIAKSPLSSSTIKRYDKYFDKNGQITYANLKETNPGAFNSLKSVPKNLNEVWIDKNEGTNAPDWWTGINPLKKKGINQKGESTGYPTQKPLILLERIIKTSSNEGDIVLDPFCGCATTCVASEKLNRQWIGIDVSHLAFDLVRERLQKEVADPENLLQYQNEIHFSTTPPKRTDTNSDDTLLKKYVYVISNPAFDNMYKVGVATDYKARLNSYQTSDPDRSYKLEYKKYTSLFREIEKHIHQKFDNRHEWVKANLKNIIKEIENYKQ